MRLLWFNLATDADHPILGFTTSWIRAVAKRVELLHVVTMRAGRVEMPDNVYVYSIGKEKGYSEVRRTVEFYRYLFRILHREPVDVCFSHMIPIFTILAAPLLKLRNVPIVTWYAHPSLTWITKLSHHLSDRMVTSLPTAYPYRHDKLNVLGQGIDTELFTPDGSVGPDEVPIILCLGRLSPVKDHPTLLKAVALLRQRWKEPFQVVILGGPATPSDNEYVRCLHDDVKELALEEIVRFELALPLKQLPSWFQRCTVHVNLTPTGFGDKVAWEAMSCGRPSLVANRGFIPTLGVHADRLLFSHGDSADLASRLYWILSLDERERASIGAYLREQVVRNHSLERLVQNLIATFTDVIKT